MRGRILVIGAQGVLGSFIARSLADAGYGVLRAGRRQESDSSFRLLDLDRPETVAAACREAADELLEAVEGTVGVITAMDRRAEVAGWLGDRVDSGESGAGESRLRVAGSLEAKGLEYDAVVLVAPSELISESSTGRRALYVALTRATQRLTVLSTDESWRA